MAQMQNAQSVALQLEKVRDKLPLLYERDDILLTMIQQRGDVERVSSRNMRLPLQIRPGGKAGLANMDGGDLGRGSGTVYDVAQVTPVFFRHAVEIDEAGGIRVERAGEGDRERGEARSEERDGAVPFVSGQGDADERQRRAGNGGLDHHDGLAVGRGGAVRDGEAAGRAAVLLQPDDSDVRSDAHDESRVGQHSVGRSVQFVDSGGFAAVGHERERFDRARRTDGRRSRCRSSGFCITRRMRRRERG